MYICQECQIRKYDHHKVRNGKRVCQKCARDIDKRGRNK